MADEETQESVERAEEHLYEMTVDMSVLESLGINLYSNAAAVLSELVANAYDADANTISISWEDENKTTIVVTDDGAGMDVEEINKRFLKAGYKKRQIEGTHSPTFNRPFMGRKGIGKLSVFSIAENVSVYTSKDGAEAHGLMIDAKELRARIEAQGPYHPVPVEIPAEHLHKGTTLVLTELKKRRASLTANALRKRLARRFDVLDQRTPEEGGFAIEINGKRITYADREELKRLEFIWEFGQETLPATVLPTNVTRFVLKDTEVSGNADWTVSGWIGTAKQPTDLTDDEEAGSLKNVIVLARKRPIQEGIIEKLDFSRIFGNYVTGQIEADFLDLDDGSDDIATSDRQRLIEDDPRVIGLQTFLRSAFVEAAEIWSSERPKREAKDMFARFPRLKEWVDGLPGYQQKAANKMIGTIASTPMEKKRETEDRAALLRAGVLAFERIGLRQVSEDLDKLSEVTADELLQLLGQQDVYESALWGDILRSRVEAISRFQGLTREDQKEKVLQEHLFRNLWLLDPSWERATLSERMEEKLDHVSPGILAKDPDDNEIVGRLDIRYVANSGRHVIVEMKRYSVNADITTYAEQGLKYYTAMKSILDQEQDDSPIEVVFVLGHKPRTKSRGALDEDPYIEQVLSTCKGRYVLYDRLIAGAQAQYEEYLEASAKVRGLNELLDSFGEVPAPSNGEGGEEIADGDDDDEE